MKNFTGLKHVSSVLEFLNNLKHQNMTVSYKMTPFRLYYLSVIQAWSNDSAGFGTVEVTVI